MNIHEEETNSSSKIHKANEISEDSPLIRLKRTNVKSASPKRRNHFNNECKNKCFDSFFIHKKEAKQSLTNRNNKEFNFECIKCLKRKVIKKETVSQPKEKSKGKKLFRLKFQRNRLVNGDKPNFTERIKKRLNKYMKTIKKLEVINWHPSHNNLDFHEEPLIHFMSR